MAKSRATKSKRETRGNIASVDLIPGTDVPVPANLPAIFPGVTHTEEETVRLAGAICEMYASDKYPLQECLKFFNVRSESTWFRWVDQIAEIKALYQDAKDRKSKVFRDSIRERATKSLERLVEGYNEEIVETVETVEVLEGERLEDGSIPEPREVVTSRTIRRKVVHVKPNATAVIFTLVNTDRDQFQRTPEPHQTGESMPTKIEVEILGGQVEPVTDESQIEDIDFEEDDEGENEGE